MSFKQFIKQKIQTALETWFDDTDVDFDAENVQEAIEASYQSGFPRAGLALIQNGNSSNNDLLSYSNLTPDTDIVFPVKTQLNELTIANRNTSVEFDLEIYKNGTAGGDLQTTVNVSTAANRNQAFDLNSLNLVYEVGDYMKIIYKDQGTNASDLVVVLWISRVAE